MIGKKSVSTAGLDENRGIDGLDQSDFPSDSVRHSLSEVWTELQQTAVHSGVLRLGAACLEDSHVTLFLQWLADGRHGEMSYLERSAEVRERPQSRFPWARSVVVITVPYSPHRPPLDNSVSSRIARYAQGDDYHLVLDEILAKLEGVIERRSQDAVTRRYVDTGSLSDRSYAAQSGLGWIGRNSMLIDPDRGSYFFIGTLLTSLVNDITAFEVADRCGSCTRCVDACPTAAILPDRTVDSGKCISYATIEQRGAIAPEVADHLEGNVFGCDICQEVCPWNDQAPAGHPAFEMRERYVATPITDLLRFEQADFSRFFQRSAIKRAKRAGMIRNTLLIAPQIPETVIEGLCHDSDEGIRLTAERRLNKG